MRTFVYEQARDIDARQFADYLDPRSTGVISIDMHRGHLDDSPDCPCPAPRARELIAPLDAFHDEARALGVRIVHVKSVLRADGSDDLGGIPPPGAVPSRCTSARSRMPTRMRSKARAGPSG
jgi:nicotinamidase-related amidase